MGEVALRDGYFSGQIQVDGSPLKLLGSLPRLEGLFRLAESLYPVVFREVILMD